MNGKAVLSNEIALNDIVLSHVGKQHEPRADSRHIAAHLGLQHQNVRELIEKYREDFQHFGILRFETGEITGRGQPEKFAMLNEEQALLLLTYSRNTKRVRELKIALVKAFTDARRALAAYQEGTLPTFHPLQDAIAAVPGGPGQWLFSNVNKAINKAAKVAAGTRRWAGMKKQAILTTAQVMAAGAVSVATDKRDALQRVKRVLKPLKKATP